MSQQLYPNTIYNMAYTLERTKGVIAWGLKNPTELEVVSNETGKAVSEIEQILKDPDFHTKMLQPDSEYKTIYNEVLTLELCSLLGL